MAILTSPPFIIFTNQLSPGVERVYIRQFFISLVMSGSQFDGYVSSDGYFVQNLLSDGYRVLVERDLSDHTNRQLANLTLFYSNNGLISILKDGYGPQILEIELDRISITSILNHLKYNPIPTIDKDLDDGFVGETDNDDFDPHHPDLNPNIEPPFIT
jgi:hypothetical protein